MTVSSSWAGTGEGMHTMSRNTKAPANNAPLIISALPATSVSARKATLSLGERGIGGRASLAPLGEVLGSDEDLARLRALAGPDDVVLLHHVDEARSLRIAEAEAPLQERDGRGTLGDDEVHRVPVDVVALPAATPTVLLHHGQLDLLVDRRALLAQELADGLDLVVGDPAAVYPRLT